MVLPIVAREAVRLAGRYVAQGLAYQSKAIKYTYSRPFLPRNVNRGAVKGIQHGLYAGGVYEIAKDFITMGVETGSAPFSSESSKETYSRNKAYSRSTVRSKYRCPAKFRYNKSSRRSSSSKRY